MYSDLIIGFDDSPPARDALALARRLALATGAHPMVLYVRPRRAMSAEAGADADGLSWDAGVEAKLDAARGMLAGVPGATFAGVADGSPARALHRAASDADAGLIVLGATHRTGRRRVVPGTTADAVIHAAPCAIAIAPTGYADAAESRAFGLVTGAVDGGDETERVARVAARIARRAGGSLRLVMVVDVPFSHGPEFTSTLGYGSLKPEVREAAEKTLERGVTAAGAGVEIETRIGEGPVADGIARESEGSDLLVIGSRGYGPLRRVVLGSSTGKILEAVTCPVASADAVGRAKLVRRARMRGK